MTAGSGAVYWIRYTCGCEQEGAGFLDRSNNHCPMHGNRGDQAGIGTRDALGTMFGPAGTSSLTTQGLGRDLFYPRIEGMVTWKGITPTDADIVAQQLERYDLYRGEVDG